MTFFDYTSNILIFLLVVGGEVVFSEHRTVMTGNAKEIIGTHDISNYTRQRIRLIDHAICSLFGNDKVKECTLEDFL